MKLEMEEILKIVVVSIKTAKNKQNPKSQIVKSK